MQSEIYHQNSQFFYLSEPFTLDHINMRHPVDSVFLYLVEENNQLLTSLKKKVVAKMTCNFQPQKTHLVAFKKKATKACAFSCIHNSNYL